MSFVTQILKAILNCLIHYFIKANLTYFQAYYRGAQACVVAFSTTDRASLYAVAKWKRKVEEECGQIPMVLVQNKIDLMHQAEVST